MLENLIETQNKMIDKMHENMFIAQKGILHIAKNTMQDEKWENYDLHKFSYALDEEIQLAKAKSIL